MSTYYYTACKKCNECIHTYTVHPSGLTVFSEEAFINTLRSFLNVHLPHAEDIRIVNEHDCEDYKEVEWTPVDSLNTAS